MWVGWGPTLSGLLFVVATSPGLAELAPLPEPLTLQDALALARVDLPEIELADADRDASAADLAEAESITGLRMNAEARLRAIEPSDVSLNRDRNDSSARLALTKRIYDFGYSAAREEAAKRAGAGNEWRYLEARQQSRLTIMQRFYEVILADLQFARDNEAMAGAYVDADRARDRHELKRLSDVDLLRFESDYQDALRQRRKSQAEQRAARSRLALAMGRPGDLVANLVPPAAPDLDAELPNYDGLLGEVLANNPELKALRADVEAAQASVEAARSGYGPVISGELEAGTWNRETNTTNPLGATLMLRMPLLTGGAKDAAVAQARADLRNARATLEKTEYAIRQQVLDLWLQLGDLRSHLEGLKVRGDYRELYLDRSRALYEMEVKADLGDAMTEISAVKLDVARAEFEWELTQSQLAALAGRLIVEEPEK